MNTDWRQNKPCYTAERTVVVFTNVAAPVTIQEVKIGTEQFNITATYTHRDGRLEIDLTDLVRLGTGYVQFAEHQTGTTLLVYIRWTTVIGQNPNTTIAPSTDYTERVREEQDANGPAFGLPSVMIVSPTDFTLAEIFAPDMFGLQIKGDATEDPTLDGNSVKIPCGVGRLKVNARNIGAFGRFVQVDEIWLKPMECGTYAKVSWLSRFGNAKVHFFEFNKLTLSKYEDTKLQDNTIGTMYGYRQDSGTEVAAVLSLDELTSYDVWYYSDIMTAATVTVEIDGVTHLARIDTKSLDIKMSKVDRYTLELEVTLTHLNS